GGRLRGSAGGSERAGDPSKLYPTIIGPQLHLEAILETGRFRMPRIGRGPAGGRREKVRLGPSHRFLDSGIGSGSNAHRVTRAGSETGGVNARRRISGTGP